jgi:hypothetical protein
MVLVFKTSVTTKAQKIKAQLDKLFGQFNWNFDLEDCDKVLRIVSKDDISNFVITELNKLDFDCTELD